MPELPEVETVRQGLEKILFKGACIKRVQLLRGDLRRRVQPSQLQVLEGQTITGLRRRAKYLLFDTQDYVLINHLGMTGSWRVAAKGTEQKHDHFYLWLNNGLRLAFNDPRRFGLLQVTKQGEEMQDLSLSSLGPEPLDAKMFNADWIMSRTRKRQTPLKVWLMDQKNVVGVGNIYASEALFMAGLRPERKAARITKLESQQLVRSVREVLRAAIKQGGSTIKDFRQAEGLSGYFQNQLKVYGRKAEPCRQCQSPIRSKNLGGRSTYWCSSCQK